MDSINNNNFYWFLQIQNWIPFTGKQKLIEFINWKSVVAINITVAFHLFGVY